MPYGETWIDEVSNKNVIDYKFTGKEYDPETGLYYFGARYLDPVLSRWISSDPAIGDYLPAAPINDEAKKKNGNLPGQGGVFNPVNMALYHYAGNNPIKYVDPDGENTLTAVYKNITISPTLSKIWEMAYNEPTIFGEVAAVSFTAGYAAGYSVGYFISRTREKSESRPIAIEQIKQAEQIFYRGLSEQDIKEYELTGQIFSYAVRSFGSSGAESILGQNSFKDLATDHQWDSSKPPSPFISVTSNFEIAKEFSSTGMVATIKTSRAISNPYNIFGEQEYLIPIVITNFEILNIQIFE